MRSVEHACNAWHALRTTHAAARKRKRKRPHWAAFCIELADREGSSLLDLLQHLEDALRRTDEHALEGLRQAATLERVAAGTCAFGHGSSTGECAVERRQSPQS